MAAEDKQIQVWARPVGHKPRVVLGARCVGGESTQWNFWSGDGGTLPSAWRSLCEALDEWSADGEDRLWDEVEVLVASADNAAKHHDQDPIAWFYEQRWWWCNWGPDEGQIGAPASLKGVSRVDAVESFRRYCYGVSRPNDQPQVDGACVAATRVD